MKDVRMSKAILLEKVRTNRERHRDQFLKAQDGFRARVIEELDQRLADARTGKHVLLLIDLVEPQDHTKDYDRVIAMLEVEQDDRVIISAQDFQQYVMDDWSWSAFASTVNTLYSSGGKVSFRSMLV